MAFTITDFHDLVRLLEQHEEWRKELRRLLLTDELLNLPNAVQEFRKHVDRRFAKLAKAQRRTEESLAAHRAETDRRFAELAEAQRRTEESLQRLSEAFAAHRQEFMEHRQEFIEHRREFMEYRAETDRRFAELAEAQRRTEESLQRLSEAFAAHRQEFMEHRQEFIEHRREFMEYRAETDRRFAELAEAQRRTEETLATHRAETDRRFAELAEAQRRTEETLRQVILRQEQFQRTLDRFGQIVGVTVEGQMVEAVQRYLAERGYVLLEPIASLAIDRIGELDGIARVRGPDGEEAWLIISVKARLGPRAVHDFVDLLHNAVVQEALRAYGVRGPVLPMIFGVVLDRRALEIAQEARVGLLLQAQGELVAPQPWALEAPGGSEDP